MSRNSLNLIDLVKGHLGGEFTNRISSLLGERPDKTTSGINAAVPGMLSAFDDTASTPDGARRLSSAVDDTDDGILGNIGTMFGSGSSSINRGSGILSSLLGGSALSDLSGNIGRSSGLSGRAVTMLLGFLGPLILGVLKREKNTRGLDSTGLSNLLAAQRSNISAAMPEGTFRTEGERVEPGYTREPLRDVTETERGPRDTSRYGESYSPVTREPARRSGLGWLLPLALLLIALGLIWHYASRRTSAGGEETGGLAQVTRLKDQLISTQASAAGILRSIKDPASADAAAPRIEALNSRLDQMHNAFDSLPSESKSTVSSFMPSVVDRLMPEVDRVLNIPGVSDRIGSQLRDMLSKFQSFS